MITYQVDVSQTHAHTLRVTLTIAQPAPEQIVSMPVWIPGSYLVREFSRHLSQLQAHQGAQQLAVHQLDKATWQVVCAGHSALVLSYEIYAFDNSVRAAFLGSHRGFFNGTSVCLRVHGREQELHHLQLHGLPKGWAIATAMPQDPTLSNPGNFATENYDELVDHPIEMGQFWHGQFQACGVPHEFIVTNAWPNFDGKRLLADAQRICEAQIHFWHGPNAKPPFKRYVFLLNAVDDGYGGLEHRASTALIAARRDLPTTEQSELSDGYVTLLGLISHEYFHTWNVKRLRPKDLTPYRYAEENHTQLLWFFEGFTSYYDDLFLRRTGLIDGPRYLKLIAKTITQVLATPGRQVQTVAQASFDAWVKYYRPDENTANATISYYSQGALVALTLDLLLRTGKTPATLDDVMRLLWQQSQGGPIAQADIAQALTQVARRPMHVELEKLIHTTLELPLQALLAQVGVAWSSTPPTMAQRLGVKASESALTGIRITSVLRGGAFEAAGGCTGDELIGLNTWRLRRLEDLSHLLNPAQSAQLLISRDHQLITLPLVLPSTSQGSPVNLKLMPEPSAAAQALQQAWLHR